MDSQSRFTRRRMARTALGGALLALTLATPLASKTVASGNASGQYTFAIGENGQGYYKYYDGYTWSDWCSWTDQPAYFRYEPRGVVYRGQVYVFYAGTDGRVYYNVHDGYAWSGWCDAAGGYYVAEPSYVKVEGDYLYLYTRADGCVYYRAYDGYDWDGWARYETYAY